MILVTGASGKTGQAVVKALTGKGVHVRAFVFRDDQVARLLKLGAEEVIVGDLLNQGDAEKATGETRATYHICPNMHPEELRIGRLMIGAAQAAGCEQFVYHSVLHPQTESMPHHWQKMRVEEHLFTSGLAYTILQPAPYMQNILAHWASITQEGVFPVPYAGATRISMVELADVAEVVARVLTEPTHAGATYELCGSEILSQQEIGSRLEQVLGQPVRVAVISREEWTEKARTAGLGTYQVETLLKMFAYYERYHFSGNGRVLKGLLGREPTTFAGFLKRITEEH